MPINASIKRTDKGLAALLKANVGKSTLRIGVFGDKGGDIVLRASVHEFGSPSRNIPSRSYLRSTLKEKRVEHKRALDNAAKMIRLGPASVRAALELLGLRVVRDIRNKIRSNIPPPLSPKTIRRKGSSVALIDTGRLIQSISHQVVMGKSRGRA